MSVKYVAKVRGGYSISYYKDEIILDERLQGRGEFSEAIIAAVMEILALYRKKVDEARQAGGKVDQLAIKRAAQAEVAALPKYAEAVKALSILTTISKAPKAPKAPKEKEEPFIPNSEQGQIFDPSKLDFEIDEL